ncbi:hypothetical protein [Marinimicrococcus flavescens]|uniref:Uncharacterized protein n=1 Tax=Marinimicrococcus flavescens TaxID=3031815 RepID=A0AAP3XQ07_9PROT|nr:hypothetical protein [Marinimicrococcus flavescens]
MNQLVPGMRALTVVLVALAAAVYGALTVGLGSNAAGHQVLDRLAAQEACLVALVTLDAVSPVRDC